MQQRIKTSVIVTTYNWPAALKRVLFALAAQTTLDFEVIIADDGSGEETLACIEALKEKLCFDIHHVWQQDEGFQAAKIRNKAVAKAKGDYLIFIDGDCLPLKNFIERHLLLARSSWLVAGNRILLDQDTTQQVLQGQLILNELNMAQWLRLKMTKACNRITPLVYIPFLPRKLKSNDWKGAKTCNLGLWKKDFVKVNGFDESFTGWGYEDSDLIIRLLRTGVKRKEGRFAIPVIHCWHEQHDRTQQKENLARLYDHLQSQIVYCPLGLNQYL